MGFFSNAAVNRLAVHSTVHQLAWSLSAIFLGVFLLHEGFSPPRVLLVLVSVLALRFVMRPLVLWAVAAIGLRRTLILGSVICSLQALALATVGGLGWALVLYVALSGLSDVFYWTTYHTLFASVGDVENRGAQVGARGVFWMLANTAGPVTGGLLLTLFGPWAAFSLAGLVGLASVVPLLRMPDVPVARETAHSFRAARDGATLFLTDGFVSCGGAFVWDLLSFTALGERYDAFGGLLGAAAVAGALGGMGFGKLLDLGHARRAVWFSVAVFSALFVVKALAAGSATGVVLSTLAANALGGFYVPALMTAVYNDAKASPCAFRFHFVAEGAWDVGGVTACLLAAVAWQGGMAPRLILLFPIAGVVLQGVILRRRYAAHAVALLSGRRVTAGA
jgi:DHA1 family inner membrane transport protein